MYHISHTRYSDYLICRNDLLPCQWQYNILKYVYTYLHAVDISLDIFGGNFELIDIPEM